MLLAKEKSDIRLKELRKREAKEDQKNHWEVFRCQIFQKRSKLIMFSSAVKVQNYRKLLQMTETSPNVLRNDAVGLDLRVQRKLFESSPAQTLKKKRNFGEMMTTHRY